MKVEYIDKLTVDVCRANPTKVYVFGDNLAGYGISGQACIRKEPNAFGVPTKRYPSMATGSFFTDKACEREHLLTALRDLYILARTRTIVFPKNGIGTGLAKMKETSPALYQEMSSILNKYFGVANGKD